MAALGWLLVRLVGVACYRLRTPLDRDWLWREARLTDPSGNVICIYHAGENRRFPPWRIAD